jgi:pimeloyl-ACP methyl ester carboxylesterase
MRFFRPLLLLVLLIAAPAAFARDAEQRFAPLDDFLVHYQSWGKVGDPAVILIHGFTLDGSFWNHQIPALAKTRRVIALDLPGHGQSGKPRDVAYTQILFARAVEAVAKDAGLDHVALVGHSMGLPVIHTVLRRGQIKVRRAAFIDGAIIIKPGDPAARAATEQFVAAMVQGLSSPGHDLVLEQFLVPMMTKTSPEERKRVLDKSRLTERHVAASTFEHMGDDAVWAPIRHDIPVLALYAKASSTGVKDWLAATYPKARLVIWDDVDHFPQIAKPERVNKELLDFLK